MAEKRRGLGRGLGALIPSASERDSRPVDVFFPGPPEAESGTAPRDGVSAAGETATAVQTDGAQVTAPSPGTTDGSNWSMYSNAGAGATTIDPSTVTSPYGASDLGAGGGLGSAGLDGVERPSSYSVASTPTNHGATNHGATNHGATDHTPTAVETSASDGPELVPVPGARFAEIPLGEIRPNPRQPRTVFDEEALVELVASVREIGVLQPVVVRPLEPAEGDARYELIMGERRWRASQQAGLEVIPAIVRETTDDDLLRDALLENLHRSDLNPLEEAAAYQQLLDDFSCTHDELAQRIHRSRPQITNTLRLLRLPPLVQRRVAAGVLSAGHARALLGLPDAAAMERLAQRIVAEGLSVRATEEIVALGGEPEAPKPAPRTPRPGDRNAALDDLATRLSDRFDTRVKVALGKSKGRLTVEFASVQDLNRILDVIAPDDPGLLR